MIERTFQDIPEGKISEADQHSFLVSLGWFQGIAWEELLRTPRVLIISEAGAGKTHECRMQAGRLWDAGEPAFFVELATLATTGLRSLLDADEESRLDAWLSSQSEVATFFLDSIDELKLSANSFESALKRLKKEIRSQLNRVRIVITTRPTPFDEQLIRQLFPVPPIPSLEPVEERFAKIAMGEYQKQREGKNKDVAPEWRVVALMPLSDKQIVEFARGQGVSDPELLLGDLRRRNAQVFARRPQDLIELCADWRVHKRIRTHRDQVLANIRVKLLPRDDRPEPAELSVDKAIDGASRLALAMQVTRRLTIRHSAASDDVDAEAALDPSIILSDWQPNERKALLERPLFGFASYGRVRFHHRSVAEFLAAERLLVLRERGMSFRALKRLLFAETKGKTIVRPSKRSVAGWMAQNETGIFELLRDSEPAVLLDEGDPESLSQVQRNQTLRAYADYYGSGGERGLSVPHIQVHRFASQDLANEINRIWHSGVENPDVREVLISLIESGRISACADIAYNLAYDAGASSYERIMALDALVALDDGRLGDIAVAIVASSDHWPDSVVRAAILRLFPKYMSVEHLCSALNRLSKKNRSFGGHLPALLEAAELGYSDLEKLRDGFLTLVSEGLQQEKEWSQITSDGAYLSGALASVCKRGLDGGQIEGWFRACILSLCVYVHDHEDEEPKKSLRKRLAMLSPDENACFFWEADHFYQSLHKSKESWKRFSVLTRYEQGPVLLKPDRDLGWVKSQLGDTTKKLDERSMLLEAAISLSADKEAWRKNVQALRSLVIDEPSLVERIDSWLKPSKFQQEERRWEKKQAERKKKEARQQAENRASWVLFWREIAEQPEEAFSTERGWATAWNLWQAMRRDGDASQSSGWNRRFIEELFDKDVADRLRRVLMAIWRNDHPSFPSERPEGKRNEFLTRWQLGLVAIYAEAEDADWASKLNDSEVKLAVRYALIELSSLPQWFDALVGAHPEVVEQSLGNELSWELEQAPGAYGFSRVLQGIEKLPTEAATLFLSRLKSWLENCGDRVDGACNLNGMTERIRQVADVILKHGDSASIAHFLGVAQQRIKEELPTELRHLWLQILMRTDPASGVTALEEQVAGLEPAKTSEAVTWLANLFGERRHSIGLGSDRFTPPLLLRLLRLAYRHVRIVDDAYHEGSYTPDVRDDAERARNSIVSALFNLKGEEGWTAKLEMATDPLCEHFKDRILAVAEESWAQEIDSDIFDEGQAVLLDRSRESPALTSEAMFAILKDRLFDLDDLLLSDVSPREAWAGISDEKVMRREIARELRNNANSIYTVDQEAVTADEKETDIRLRSVASNHEAVIELKLGDGRGAKDLLDTIENQLVKKYMAAENSRAGALLVTLAKDRQWEHPDEKRKIEVEELFSLLRREAERVQDALGGAISITVHFLDLRPRLAVEKSRKSKKTKAPGSESSDI